MDTLTSMKVFVRVAQAGSFARAADQLQISRAMVTKHIMSLENRLGLRLLNRTTRRLSLTEVGTAYRERCAQILAEIEEAEMTATQMQTQPRGTLRVTAPTSFGSFHLAPAIADYIRQYPDVEVSMALADRTPDLADEGIDVAVRIGLPDTTSMVARRIAQARMVICGAPAYFQRHGTPRQPQDLVEHNCLRYLYRARDEWEFKSANTMISVPIKGNIESTAGDALRMAAIHGAGLVLQPTYMVGEDLKAGRLLAVMTDYEPVGADIYAFYLHRKHLSNKVRTFVDFLLERYSPRPYWDDWDIRGPSALAAHSTGKPRALAK